MSGDVAVLGQFVGLGGLVERHGVLDDDGKRAGLDELRKFAKVGCWGRTLTTASRTPASAACSGVMPRYIPTAPINSPPGSSTLADRAP